MFNDAVLSFLKPSITGVPCTCGEQNFAGIQCSEKKVCSENARLQLMVPLEKRTLYDVISMVYSVEDRGNMWLIC